MADEKIEPMEITLASRGVAAEKGFLLGEDAEKFRILSGKNEVWIYKLNLISARFQSQLTKDTLKAQMQKQVEKAKKHQEIETSQ